MIKRFSTASLKTILFFVIFGFCITVSGQIRYEKGYIIDDTGTKTECLIENKDWVYNPETFRYKLTENASPQEGTLATIKEFGVYGYSKYIRAIVEMDQSKSYPIRELSTEWSPVWVTDTVFLKTLVDGKATLYYYEAFKLKKFYFTKEPEDSVRPLVYKQYTIANSRVAENVSFRQQLLSEVACEKQVRMYFEKMEYTLDALTRHFQDYNKCMGGAETEIVKDSNAVSSQKPKERDFLNLKFTPGISNSRLVIDDASYANNDIIFNRNLFLRAGVELEYILGFNKNKWGLFVEPSFQYLTMTQKYPANHFGVARQYEASVKYHSIELPLGLRYYLFLKSGSRCFFNALVVPPALKYFGDSYVSYASGAAKLKVEAHTSFGFGGGYTSGDLSIECRYHFNQDIFGNYIFDDYGAAYYQRLSFIVGYRFMKWKTKS